MKKTIKAYLLTTCDGVIFGAGSSEKAALNNAKQWIDQNERDDFAKLTPSDFCSRGIWQEDGNIDENSWRLIEAKVNEDKISDITADSDYEEI